MNKIFGFVFICLVAGCSNNNSYDIKSDSSYEKGKSTLQQIEQKNSVNFLKVTSSTKKNLFQQIVVKGKITNVAKVVSYKDIGIRLFFYSKTGALLEQDDEVVYENINPGGSANFKSKFFAPKGSDSVAVKITGAKF